MPGRRSGGPDPMICEKLLRLDGFAERGLNSLAAFSITAAAVVAAIAAAAVAAMMTPVAAVASVATVAAVAAIAAVAAVAMMATVARAAIDVLATVAIATIAAIAMMTTAMAAAIAVARATAAATKVEQAGFSRLLAADHGDAHQGEENCNTKYNNAVHPRILQNAYRYRKLKPLECRQLRPSHRSTLERSGDAALGSRRATCSRPANPVGKFCRLRRM
jgi:hypothetical protein